MHITRKSKVRIHPLVFYNCPHCTQMVSKTTFYHHQGLYEQLETESSSRSGESFYEQLYPTVNSVDQWTDCYAVDGNRKCFLLFCSFTLLVNADTDNIQTLRIW